MSAILLSTKRWRRAGRLTGFGVMLALAAPARDAAAQTWRAVLVGVNDYRSARPSPTGAEDEARARPRDAFRDLAGAVNDARSLRAVLEARYGLEPSRVTMLLDKEASRRAILETLARVVAESGSGDRLLVFLAGHGSQVRNAKSTETGQLDDTFVPADSADGAPDIRDKELARLYHRALDRGVRLTVIQDTCHSGSGARSLRAVVTRQLPPPPAEIAEAPDPGPIPAARGALILASARKDELAGEAEDPETRQMHGAFTLALLRVLRDAPVGESAARVFERTRAIMQWSTSQSPSLQSTAARAGESLFGHAAADRRGAAVAVRRVDPDGGVVVGSGFAAGVAAGSVLVWEHGDTRHRFTVERALPGEALARAAAGSAAAPAPPIGALLEIERLVVPPGDPLRVWLPPADDLARWRTLRRTLERRLPAATLAATTFDEHGPHPLVLREAGGWTLRLVGPHGLVRIVDRSPAGEAIARRLAEPGTASSVFVAAPLDGPTRTALVARLADAGVDVVADADRADYWLVGRPAGEAVAYAFVRPEAASGAVGNMPNASAWSSRGGASLVDELEQRAQRLARVKGWLTLASPGADAFPYELVLHGDAGEVPPGGFLCAGEKVGMSLRRTADRPAERRWVYVFAIDAEGKSTPLFPGSEIGNSTNWLPPPGAPDRVLLDDGQPTIGIQDPYGTDTYLLLSTRTPISPLALEFDGAASRSASGSTPLERLLRRVGARGLGLGPPPSTEASWSISRVTLTSLPPGSPVPGGSAPSPKVCPAVP